MKFSRLAAAAALLTAGLAASPASAAIALQGQVLLQADSTVGAGPLVRDFDEDAFTGGPNDLSASVSATAAGGADKVVTHGAITAHWDTDNKGSVAINDFGWTVDATDPDIHDLEARLATPIDGRGDWSYEFATFGRETLNLAFEMSGSGDDLSGLGNWDLFVSDGEITTHFVLMRGYESGLQNALAFSQELRADRTYRVALVNLDRLTLSGDTAGGSRRASESGSLNWSISPVAGVPEPSTWALSILGFGLTGAALRRRGRSALA